MTINPLPRWVRFSLALLLHWAANPAYSQDAPPGTEPPAPQPAAIANPPEAPAPEDVPEPPRPSRSRRSSRSSQNDIVMVGTSATVKAGEVVHDVVVVGANATIDGTVTGDFVVVGGLARLGPEARITRDLVVIGWLEADPGASLGRNPVVVGPGVLMAATNFVPTMVIQAGQQWFSKGVLLARPLPHQFAWAWIVAGVSLLLYLFVAVLFPKPIQATVNVLTDRPGSALMLGLLAGVLTLPLLLLLAVTIVGAFLIPLALGALVVAFLVGKVSVYRYGGEALASQFGLNVGKAPALALLLGAVLFFALYCVPVLGAIVWCLAAPLGLGAVLLAASGRPKSVANGVPPLLGSGESSRGGIVSPEGVENAALLPRVGFWMRFLATALDFVLVGIIAAALMKHPRWFLILWVSYHLVFWAWKGTTLGGIVCSLRIVRVDGRPITPAVAVVRLLASFFSAAVAGLGFFWAGWSADKQSWHDKIAGTVIVKVPKGTPLI